MKKNKCEICCVGLWIPDDRQLILFEDDLISFDKPFKYFNFCPYCRS